MHAIRLMALAALLLAPTAHAQVCNPVCANQPAICCTPPPQGDDFANYEVKADLGLAFNVDFNFKVNGQDVLPPFNQGTTLGRLRRLGAPNNALQPRHLGFMEITNLPGGDSRPFCVASNAAPVHCGKLGRARWLARTMTKDLNILPPPPAAPIETYLCYWLNNTGLSRFTVSWVDQFGPRQGSFGKPVTACFPVNGTNANPIVCYGGSDNLVPQQGPGTFFVNSDLKAFGEIEAETVDEYCARATHWSIF